MTLHPGVRLDIQAGGAGKGMADVLGRATDIGMVSRNIHETEFQKGAYTIPVAGDAVVPIISLKHPCLHQLKERGLTREEFQCIFLHGRCRKWNQLPGISCEQGIKVFTRSDAAGAPETWAQYLGVAQEDLLGVGVFGDPGLVEVISHDRFSIGFSNIAYVYNIASGKPYSGISPLPVDINGNGRIDPEESIYDLLDDLNDAIAKGIYPTPPARVLYFVTKDRPTNRIVIEFLKWVLNEGQGMVGRLGFVALDEATIEQALSKLN